MVLLGPSFAGGPSVDPIVGGEPTEAGEFDDVVELMLPGGDRCSGVVVTPRVVLTAAHCIDDLRSADSVAVRYGEHETSNPSIEAVEFGAHPDYDPDPDHEDLHDYGYVVLPSDFVVPGGYVAPITTQEEWDEAMVSGREVTIVGFGDDGSGDGIGIKRKVTTTIRRFSDEGLEFFAGGEQQDSCGGDSGGPAYVRMGDGSWRIAGLVSRGPEVCGTGGWYSTPYAGLCWVDEHTGAGLSDPACNTCDCLDMKKDDDRGCAIGGSPGASAWLLLFVAALRRRRVGMALALTTAAFVGCGDDDDDDDDEETSGATQTTDATSSGSETSESATTAADGTTGDVDVPCGDGLILTCSGGDVCIEDAFDPACTDLEDPEGMCPEGQEMTFCGGAGQPCCCLPPPPSEWRCVTPTDCDGPATCACLGEVCTEGRECTSLGVDPEHFFRCESPPKP
jgi:V8-like Glu-specific endopeptidase